MISPRRLVRRSAAATRAATGQPSSHRVRRQPAAPTVARGGTLAGEPGAASPRSAWSPHHHRFRLRDRERRPSLSSSDPAARRSRPPEPTHVTCQRIPYVAVTTRCGSMDARMRIG